ncbi:hypothetical protein H696_02817 [Fonticula alba]|uniref:Metaxin glutathione S-transferase domain-containing protein n=1 Tax=Fonticula alba TaxID=691883 RepID=A0A058Z8T3_FONAL|nr:hypothetical protein H696_02817 [Fonticula alba]KCV70476.1 hypothetical protein H696_02817 [Fonticula alba]|eukprot:XP_009494992.1 hypothetical protein H696_02817 [Fonticula alba]
MPPPFPRAPANWVPLTFFSFPPQPDLLRSGAPFLPSFDPCSLMVHALLRVLSIDHLVHEVTDPTHVPTGTIPALRHGADLFADPLDIATYLSYDALLRLPGHQSPGPVDLSDPTCLAGFSSAPNYIPDEMTLLPHVALLPALSAASTGHTAAILSHLMDAWMFLLFIEPANATLSRTPYQSFFGTLFSGSSAYHRRMREVLAHFHLSERSTPEELIFVAESVYARALSTFYHLSQALGKSDFFDDPELPGILDCAAFAFLGLFYWHGLPEVGPFGHDTIFETLPNLRDFVLRMRDRLDFSPMCRMPMALDYATGKATSTCCLSPLCPHFALSRSSSWTDTRAFGASNACCHRHRDLRLRPHAEPSVDPSDEPNSAADIDAQPPADPDADEPIWRALDLLNIRELREFIRRRKAATASPEKATSPTEPTVTDIPDDDDDGPEPPPGSSSSPPHPAGDAKDANHHPGPDDTPPTPDNPDDLEDVPSSLDLNSPLGEDYWETIFVRFWMERAVALGLLLAAAALTTSGVNLLTFVQMTTVHQEPSPAALAGGRQAARSFAEAVRRAAESALQAASSPAARP